VALGAAAPRERAAPEWQQQLSQHRTKISSARIALAIGAQLPILLVILFVVGADQLLVGANEPLANKLFAPLDILLGECLSWQLSLNSLPTEAELSMHKPLHSRCRHTHLKLTLKQRAQLTQLQSRIVLFEQFAHKRSVRVAVANLSFLRRITTPLAITQ
jgi:hypothetical protein